MYALNTEGCISECRLYQSFDQGETWWPVGLPFVWSSLLALSAVDAREIYAWSDTIWLPDEMDLGFLVFAFAGARSLESGTRFHYFPSGTPAICSASLGVRAG